MADEKKYDLTLGRHTEQVTEKELALIKEQVGDRFANYEVTPIQPAKPSGEVQTAKSKPTPAAE